MAGIFINYRRDDAPGVAGRLFDYLALKFSRRDLFMDVDAMKPGVDFAKQLDTQVSQCQVLLAVIGPHWLDAKDQTGQRRLDNEHDYVRIELASALMRDIPVIPVLVDGAAMPSEASLADDLKPLARRHALELRHTRFNADADSILHALEAVVPRRHTPWRLIAAGAVIAACAVALIVSWPKLSARLHPAAAPAVVATAPPVANPSPPAPAIANNTAAPAAAPAPPPVAAQPVAPSAAPSALPAGVKLGDMLPGVAMPGTVLRIVEVPADPAECQTACRAELRCVAWTYTRPAGSGQSAHCSIKPLIPAQVSDMCCTSGIERMPDPAMREPPPVPASVAGALSGVELEGGTYRFFNGPDATPEGCQAACRADGQCLAWDYMRPGVFSSDARCFLKNRASNQVASTCCIAGFERQTPVTAPAAPAAPASPVATAAPPAASNGPQLNTNLFGSDYRNFVLPSADWTACQSACKADNRCLAWTMVNPGVQGPNARCWLKDKIPRAAANSCCTSGIERAQAP
jgi:hypothetical protein